MTDYRAHRPDCVAGEGTTHWYRCEERIAKLEKALRYIAGEDIAGMDAHLRPQDVARAVLEGKQP